jgi:8-oxo-dGTP pyrophosphatase MutT (NUDIX family)
MSLDLAERPLRVPSLATQDKMPTPIPQASAIPFRRQGNDWSFCLITSSRRGRWGFPKGIIEGEDTAEITALKEAHEEAGLRGRICGEALGEYRYQKWGTDLDVRVFLMEVEFVDEEWPEAAIRQREWLNAKEAANRVAANGHVAAVFDVALQRLRRMTAN